MIIYKARNRLNGKLYVGMSTKSLAERCAEHIGSARWNSRTVFHCAIRKYGPESFTFRVIDSASSLAELKVKEKLWIKKLNCRVPSGYNLTDGGDGVVNPPFEVRERNRLAHLGKKASEETKRKMSLSQTGRKMPPGFAEKMRLLNTGKKHSLETRRKLSLVQRSRKRKPHSAETRAKIAAAHKGMRHSQEVLERISAKLRGRPSWNKGRSWTQAERDKLSVAHIGNRHSDETRQKMSAAQREHWIIRKAKAA